MKKDKKQLKLKKRILIESPNQVKDRVIYVRMQADNVREIDVMKKKFKVRSRSEMIRTLVVEAINNVA